MENRQENKRNMRDRAVVWKEWIRTLRKESREPFSMYSVMIITGLPERTERDR